MISWRNNPLQWQLKVSSPIFGGTRPPVGWCLNGVGSCLLWFQRLKLVMQVVWIPSCAEVFFICAHGRTCTSCKSRIRKGIFLPHIYSKFARAWTAVQDFRLVTYSGSQCQIFGPSWSGLVSLTNVKLLWFGFVGKPCLWTAATGRGLNKFDDWFLCCVFTVISSWGGVQRHTSGVNHFADHRWQCLLVSTRNPPCWTNDLRQNWALGYESRSLAKWAPCYIMLP